MVEFSLVIVNLDTGAAACMYPVYMSVEIETIGRMMNRDPDFTEDGVSSWANVELSEIEHLMMDCDEPDPEGFAIVSTWNTEYRNDQHFWSLFFDEKQQWEATYHS